MIGTRTMRRFAALVLVALLIGVFPVLAATVDISIPLETVIEGEAGSQHVLDTVEVPVESRGQVCQVSATARNQDSEHPDSDLLISSATDVEILDVENIAGGTVFVGGLITLSDSVTVTLSLGADRVFSAGLDLVIDCPPFNPTTTTTTGGSSSSSIDDEATSTSGGAGVTTDTSGGAGVTTDTSGGAGVTSDTSGGAGVTTDTSGGPGVTPVEPTVLGASITAPSSSVAGSSETLPFTGITDGRMGGVAFALVALGGLVVLSIHRRETEVVVAEAWQPRVDFYDIKF
jgi:hypothetical protein